MNNIIKPNKERAKGAIILLWIMLALEVLMFISDYMEYSLLQRALNGGGVDYQDATSNDTRQLLIGILYLIAIIISGIFFINWFRRAYNNLYLLKVPRLSYSESSAGWSWFVPFLNFVRPYQIMKETWESTDDILNRYTNYQHNFKINTVNMWWGLWIIQGILGYIGSRMYLTDDINLYLTGSIMGMISNFLATIGAFVAIKMIKEYSQMENALAQNQVDLHNTFMSHGTQRN